MSKQDNLTDFLTDVADAIREKKGTTEKINPQNFSDEIRGIESGGYDNGWNTNVELKDSTHYGNSNITAIDIEGVSEILDYAFAGSDISEIDLSNVTKIGAHAFEGCTNLTSIDLTGVQDIGDEAFAGCESLNSIQCSSQTPPRIGEFVFNDVPAYIKVPQEYYDTYVSEASDYADRFYYDSPIYMIIEDPEVKRILFSNNIGNGIGITESQAKAVTNISTYFKRSGIRRFKELRSFGVTNINNSAFECCYNLEVIGLDNIVKVDNYAFLYCTSLKDVGSLDNIVTLGSSVFNVSPIQIKTLKMPKLETLGYANFIFSEIEEIEDLGSITSMPRGSADTQHLFSFSMKLKRVVLPNTLVNLGECFVNCVNLRDININNNPNIKELKGFNATPLSPIEELYLPNITLYSPLFNKTRIRKVNLGDAPMTQLDGMNGCFGEFSYTEEVILPDCCEKIVSYPFYKYTNLKYVHLPEQLKEIPYYCFSECGLESITIPKNVAKIGTYAFFNCKQMKLYDFRSLEHVITLDNINAFNGIPTNCKIVVPDNLYDQWITATNWSSLASKIVKASEFVEPTTE